MMKEIMTIDRIGAMMYNAYIWKMEYITIPKPAKETIAVIKGLGYKVKDFGDDIRILVKK